MDDRDLEHLLRHYQPAGPPAELGARILAPPVPRRAWPWAAAAAALLALAIGLHESANRTQAALAASTGDARSADAFRALREVATDDEIAIMEITAALARADAARTVVTVWP